MPDNDFFTKKRYLRPYVVNGMITVGSLTQEEFEKMRYATVGELVRMGIEREKHFRKKRSMYLDGKTNLNYKI